MAESQEQISAGGTVEIYIVNWILLIGVFMAASGNSTLFGIAYLPWFNTFLIYLSVAEEGWQ